MTTYWLKGEQKTETRESTTSNVVMRRDKQRTPSIQNTRKELTFNSNSNTLTILEEHRDNRDESDVPLLSITIHKNQHT